MNRVKEFNIKNCTYYFFDDTVNIKNLDPINIKIDEKPYKNVFIYYIGFMFYSGYILSLTMKIDILKKVVEIGI